MESSGSPRHRRRLKEGEGAQPRSMVAHVAFICSAFGTPGAAGCRSVSLAPGCPDAQLCGWTEAAPDAEETEPSHQSVGSSIFCPSTESEEEGSERGEEGFVTDVVACGSPRSLPELCDARGGLV